MIDPVSMIAGVVILGAGYLLGRVRRSGHPTLPRHQDVTCPGCAHSLSYRDPQTGSCTQTVERPKKWNGFGEAVSFEHVPCTCRNHVSAHQLGLESTLNAIPIRGIE